MAMTPASMPTKKKAAPKGKPGEAKASAEKAPPFGKKDAKGKGKADKSTAKGKAAPPKSKKPKK